MPAAGEAEADKYLFDRGSEALQRRRWLEAREYFRRLVDTYPQSQYRQEAKLGIGDSFLGEDRLESYVLGANEFREFLRFYPLNSRADYAQYRLAVSQVEQMLGPQRDQAATLEALRELEVFVRTCPKSDLMPEVLKLQRHARDRLSDHEYGVGLQYFRSEWYPGAIARFLGVLKDDPGYTRRDAVYYHLAESYHRGGRPAEGLPYFLKLLEEFPASEFRARAEARVAELKR
jgi:outer membrane protein assembly factor BamD